MVKSLTLLEKDFLFGIQNGDMNVVDWHCHKNVNINAQDENGNTAMMWAVDCPDLMIVQKLFWYDPNLNIVNNKGETVAYLAVKKNKNERLKLLVKKGADVNIPNNNGTTPLMCAICTGNTEAALYLIQEGKADILAEDKNGFSALTWAAYYGQREVFKELKYRHLKSDENQIKIRDRFRKAYHCAVSNKQNILLLFPTDLNRNIDADGQLETRQNGVDEKRQLVALVTTLSSPVLSKIIKYDKSFSAKIFTAGLSEQLLSRLTYDGKKTFYQNIRSKMTPQQCSVMEQKIRIDRSRDGGR